MLKLEALSEANPVEGFWKCYNRLRNAGTMINHKRLHRICKLMKLPLRSKVKKRLPSRIKEPLSILVDFTQTWSIDL
jgi:putative transposase